MEKLIIINIQPTTDDSEFPKQIRPIRARESGGQVLLNNNEVLIVVL